MATLAGSACMYARNGLGFLRKKSLSFKLSHEKLSTRYIRNFNNRTLTTCNRELCFRALTYGRTSVSDACRLFSIDAKNSSKSPSEVKGLADEILKAQVKKEEQSKDDKDKEEKAKADEFSKRMMKYSFVLFSAMFSGSVVLIVLEWGAPQKAEDGTEIKDEFSDMNIVKQYIFRTHKELLHYDKLIKDPSREKLLPDPLTEPYYQPPYTLVLEMTGVLVHPDWTYQTGWRFKKRPGVDFFLQQIGPPLFEVVIYTAEQGFTAFPIIDGLDPNGHVMYRLFRDATRYMNGHHVKDLSCLNRDLSKVIMIDWNSKSVQLNLENSMVIKRWNGDDQNRDLMDLAIFLRTIAGNEVEDVRPVLQFYSQFDDPIAAFKENQRKLSEENEEKSKQVQTQAPTLVQSWTSGLRKR